MKIVIKKGKSKKPYSAVIKAANGKNLFTSGMYAKKKSARRVADLIIYSSLYVVDEAE